MRTTAGRTFRLPETCIAPGSLDERLGKQATISIVDCIMGVVACRDQKFRIEDVIVLMKDVIDHDRVHVMD